MELIETPNLSTRESQDIDPLKNTLTTPTRGPRLPIEAEGEKESPPMITAKVRRARNLMGTGIERATDRAEETLTKRNRESTTLNSRTHTLLKTVSDSKSKRRRINSPSTLDSQDSSLKIADRAIAEME